MTLDAHPHNFRFLLVAALCILTFKSLVYGLENQISITTDDFGEDKNMPFGFPIGNTGSDSAPPAYPPPQASLDVDGYPVAPPPLRLVQVHAFVRHGERTPVGVRLNGPPANVPEHWNMCRTARRFQTSVSEMLNSESSSSQYHHPFHVKRIVERPDGRAVEGECLLGELTDLGRQSTYNYGVNLRRIYIDRLSFLPDKLETPDTVYFRTTNVPRTTESLQEIIRGLYPKETSLPPIRVRNGKDENLIGNTYSCKRLEALQIGFAKAAADAYNPTLERLDATLSKYIDGNPIRVDGRPRASGIFDTIRSAVAHGIEVPAEFKNETIISSIERAVTSEWFSGYKTEEVRRLGMGRLLDDMMRKMQHRIAKPEQDPLKLLVHSTHDSGLAALCQTLDVYDERWPAFTASVTFELFKDTSGEGGSSPGQSLRLFSRLSKSSPKHYVRMRYQNKTMTLPICAAEGKHLPGHPEFCTLEAFKSRVEQLTPKDWTEECSLGTGSKHR
ncbi:phosphoglycerate mutase-like protein [Coprinopsis marcescibilis]|uniref:Phosphoglycerate mutase-like protein n=1 Tax=Coprinopsis marcescibilis TaxID=230819 RepID=A0A5C3KQS0_COPMA|nr:phosphoglycerate mutase-like protein [Coprinopsis marcescibilis]